MPFFFFFFCPFEPWLKGRAKRGRIRAGLAVEGEVTTTRASMHSDGRGPILTKMGPGACPGARFHRPRTLQRFRILSGLGMGEGYERQNELFDRHARLATSEPMASQLPRVRPLAIPPPRFGYFKSIDKGINTMLANLSFGLP